MYTRLQIPAWGHPVLSKPAKQHQGIVKEPGEENHHACLQSAAIPVALLCNSTALNGTHAAQNFGIARPLWNIRS